MSKRQKDNLKDAAKVITMFVRDGLEDLHQQGNLPQELMPALNLRIRNAIYTAFYAMEHASEDWRCDRLLAMKCQGIPAYEKNRYFQMELQIHMRSTKKLHVISSGYTPGNTGCQSAMNRRDTKSSDVVIDIVYT